MRQFSKTRILLLVAALSTIATILLANTTTAQPTSSAVRFVLQLELKEGTPAPGR